MAFRAILLLSVAVQLVRCAPTAGTGVVLVVADAGGSGSVIVPLVVNTGVHVNSTVGQDDPNFCDASNDLYFQFLLDKTNQNKADEVAVLNANPNAATDNSTGYYLGILKLSQQNGLLITHVGQGNQTLTREQCLDALKNITMAMFAQADHRNDSIPQPPIGEEIFHDLVQRFGEEEATFSELHDICRDAPNPGPYLKALLESITVGKKYPSDKPETYDCFEAINATYVSHMALANVAKFKA